MKSWYASSLLLWAGAAWGSPLDEGHACLEASDLPCAERVAANAGESAAGKVA